MIDKRAFAELRRMMNPPPAMRDLFTAIACLFEVPKWKRWERVQSFIAAAATQQKILSLKPQDLTEKIIKKAHKWINEHEETVNRLSAYKANKRLAPLEPWLRSILALAEKIVIDGVDPEQIKADLEQMRRKSTMFQRNMEDIAITVA